MSGCGHDRRVMCGPCMLETLDLRHRAGRVEREAEALAVEEIARRYSPTVRAGACPVKDRPRDFGRHLAPESGKGWLDELGTPRGARPLDFDQPHRIGRRFRGGVEPYDVQATTATTRFRRRP